MAWRDIYRELAADCYDGDGFYIVHVFTDGMWRHSEPEWCYGEEGLAELLEEAGEMFKVNNTRSIGAGRISDERARELGYM